MRTGDQWENTYHYDTDGLHTSHLYEGKVMEGSPSGDGEMVFAPADAKLTGEETTNQGMLFSPATGTGQKDDPLVSENDRRSAIRDAYSLDPSSDPAIAAANVAGRKPGGNNVSAAKRKKDAKVAEDAIYESDIPMHEIQSDASHPRVVAADRSPTMGGSRGSGRYSPRHNVAFTKSESKTRRWSEEVQVPTAGDGEWIDNPRPMNMEEHRFRGFGDWEDGRADESNRPAPPNDADMAAHKAAKKEYKQQKSDHAMVVEAFGEDEKNRRTGETEKRLSHEQARELAGDVDSLPDSLQDMGSYDLRSGPSKPFSPKKGYERDQENWEGRKAARDEFGIEENQLYTKPAPAHNSKQYSVHIGDGYKYTPMGADIDVDTEYWGRQKATEWETQQIEREKKFRVARNSTMTHEIGHGMHLQGGGGNDVIDAHTVGRRADPLYEGVADGYMDRYSARQAGTVSEDHIAPEDNTHTDSLRSEDMRDRRVSNSYGSDSGQWRGDIERALYTAARAHSAENPDDLPSGYRDDTLKSLGREHSQGRTPEIKAFAGLLEHHDFDQSNELALGRMMEESPAARAAFGPPTTGRVGHTEQIGEAAHAAHGTYLKHLDDHRKEAAGNPVESQLPFGAWYGTKKQQAEGKGYGIK